MLARQPYLWPALIGTVLFLAVGLSSARLARAEALLRGLVRGAPDDLRRGLPRLRPPGGRRHPLRRLARRAGPLDPALRRDGRRAADLARGAAAAGAPPAARCGSRPWCPRGAGWRACGCEGRGLASPGRPRRPVLPRPVPHAGTPRDRPPLLAVDGAHRRPPAVHRRRARGPLVRRRATSGPAPACRSRGRSAASRRTAPPPARRSWSPAAPASDRCARSRRTCSLRGHQLVVVHRAHDAAGLALAAEFTPSPGLHVRARARPARASWATTRSTRAHLRPLVPDIASRDVFVCGPPAMTDAVVRSARALGRAAHRHPPRGDRVMTTRWRGTLIYTGAVAAMGAAGFAKFAVLAPPDAASGVEHVDVDLVVRGRRLGVRLILGLVDVGLGVERQQHRLRRRDDDQRHRHRRRLVGADPVRPGPGVGDVHRGPDHRRAGAAGARGPPRERPDQRAGDADPRAGGDRRPVGADRHGLGRHLHVGGLRRSPCSPPSTSRADACATWSW